MPTQSVGVSTSSNGHGSNSQGRKQPKKSQKKKGPPGNPNNNKTIAQTRKNQTAKTVSMSPEAKKWFENLMNPKYPFMMPRIVPCEAAPHHYKTSIHIKTGDGAFPDTKAGAFIVSPSILNPIVAMKQTAASKVWTNSMVQQMHHIDGGWANMDIDYDSPLFDDNNNTLTSLATKNGQHYKEESSQVVNGGRYYRVKSATTPATANAWGFSIRNRGPSTESLSAWICDYYESTGARSNRLTGPTSGIAAGSTATISIPEFTQAPGSDGICVGIRVASGANLDVTMRDPGITAGADWVWDPQPFFQASEQSVMEDFKQAEKFSLTAFSALIANTSAQLNKGGTIRAAQLPGGTRDQLPLDPEKLYTFLGNVNSIHTLRGLQLSDGAFWSYHPEKIQDVMFRKHLTPEDSFLYGDNELPYFAVAFKWAADSAAPELDAELNICMEYLTNSLVSPKFTSPTDTTRLIELWLTLGNRENHVSHNPNHFDAVKAMTKIVLDRTLMNPEFRSAAFRAGKTLGKIALAAAV